ncbi:ABC-F family ATP-binding cassette domain-containing protein [Eubacteriales bacterium OttesenSCG-928-N13]|nr:ABC-F family ATP-binding cassette domain-containing protein [Eubacteriales bacterium OttesenSCG-928-N13]
MVLLTLQGISKAFGLNAILNDVSLTLMQGSRMGLVGVNGSGKSTLFKIITGEMAPDSGTVSMIRGTSIGVLTQQADIQSDLTLYEELARVFEPVQRMEERLRELEQLMAEHHQDEKMLGSLSDEYARLTDRFEQAGGYEWPSRIQGVLAGLGFAKGREQDPARLLSGGEKTRLCLARLLLAQPDLLMLDEPTNHLDLPATGWLEDTLKRYSGTVLVISHDRYFLNAVCDAVAELSMTHLTQYTGNYDMFTQKRQADLERQLKEYQMQQKEIARQQAIIARYKMYNTEASLIKARSREKVLDKMDRVDRPQDESKVRFSFQTRRRSGDDVLMIQHISKSFDGRPLIQDFSLHLRLGDRVALIGANGVGKTTLFNIVTGKLKPDNGLVQFGSNVDVGYYDQHQSGLHPEKTVMDELWDDFPRLEPDQVRGTLALFLLTGDDVFQRIQTLSGGEKGRVALAKLMLKRDNLLLMDEPTNHLDMDSREVLEHALQDFEGTILAISHDRYFINRTCNRVVEMAADGITEYLGNYDDYIEKKRRMNAPEEIDPYGGRTRTEIEKEKRKERFSRESAKQIKQKVADLERRIADVEQRMTELEIEMSDPDTYQDRRYASDVAFEHKELVTTLATLYEQWEEAAEVVADQE